MAVAKIAAVIFVVVAVDVVVIAVDVVVVGVVVVVGRLGAGRMGVAKIAAVIVVVVVVAHRGALASVTDYLYPHFATEILPASPITF